MSSAEPSRWSGEPLPRGRHKLSPEEVSASQRDRLLRAMAEVVGERGYPETTVARVTERARVSPNAFYKFFRDKTDCFIELCEALGEELFEQLAPPAEPAGEPLEALAVFNERLRAYLRWWSERPALARAYFVELPAAGTRAIEERARQDERFAGILRGIADRARELWPELPPLRDIELRAASILSRELVAAVVRAGRVEEVEELEDDLRYLLLKLLTSEDLARAAAQA